MKKLIVGLLLAATCLPVAAQKNHNSEIAKNLDIFNSLYKELDLYYVDTLDANTLVTNAIDYMLNKIDPYTQYFPANRKEQLDELSSGMKYGGIGALIRYEPRSARCCIDEPYENMPAQKAGLLAGDVILSIDDTIVKPREKGSIPDYISKVSSNLRGESGTAFTIKVQRAGVKEPLTFKIVRQTVALPVITYTGMLPDSVGYVAFNQFTRNITRDLRRAMTDLKMKGANKLVLDLRGNGGGSMNEAISLVNLFIPRGKEVLATKGRLKEETQTYKTTDEPWDANMPLVVLVDDNSASAAEITSGALQDYDRAVIVGIRTYGKGLVQQTREIVHKATLKLTTSKYYIPSGRCVQALDYQHRNADGSPMALPESQSKVFYTAAGRPVRDGGGITPDVVVNPDSLSNFVIALDTCAQIFHACNSYYFAHPTVAPASKFSLTDDEYQAFADSVVKGGFTYDNNSKRVFDLLKTTLKRDGVTADSEMKALQEKVMPNPEREFQTKKDEAKRFIEAQLMRRYYYQRGEAEYLLRDDNTLKRGLEILSNPKEYKKLLSKKK